MFVWDGERGSGERGNGEENAAGAEQNQTIFPSFCTPGSKTTKLHLDGVSVAGGKRNDRKRQQLTVAARQLDAFGPPPANIVPLGVIRGPDPTDETAFVGAPSPRREDVSHKDAFMRPVSA